MAICSNTNITLRGRRALQVGSGYPGPYPLPKPLKGKLVPPGSAHSLHREQLACNTCGRLFSFRSVLERHRRIHTGERPHKCPICYRQFTQVGNMNLHVKKRHLVCMPLLPVPVPVPVPVTQQQQQQQQQQQRGWRPELMRGNGAREWQDAGGAQGESAEPLVWPKSEQEEDAYTGEGDL